MLGVCIFVSVTIVTALGNHVHENEVLSNLQLIPAQLFNNIEYPVPKLGRPRQFLDEPQSYIPNEYFKLDESEISFKSSPEEIKQNQKGQRQYFDGIPDEYFHLDESDVFFKSSPEKKTAKKDLSQSYPAHSGEETQLLVGSFDISDLTERCMNYILQHELGRDQRRGDRLFSRLIETLCQQYVGTVYSDEHGREENEFTTKRSLQVERERTAPASPAVVVIPMQLADETTNQPGGAQQVPPLGWFMPIRGRRVWMATNDQSEGKLRQYINSKKPWKFL